MSWPRWIDELKDRYLADEANVFVIDGVTDDRRFLVDGEPLDAVRVLVRFLRRTREIVGVLRPAPLPSRLEFADFTDRQRFENVVRAAEVLSGKPDALPENEPGPALGRIWRALGTAGTAQAYIVTDTERLVPMGRRRVDPIPGAPDLFAWARHPTLRQSNNLIVFLASEVGAIRSELLDGAGLIHADDRPGRDDAPVGISSEDVTEESAPEAPPPAPPSEGEGVRGELEHALIAAICARPDEHRVKKLPVMEAVAQVLARHRPDRFGPVSIGLDPEGDVVVQGPGTDAFVAAWKGDVALDAAAGMLLKGVTGSYTASAPPPLDATGLGALVRRVERVLRS